MAYMSQEKKKSLSPAIKKVLKKHGLKGSLSVQNHSTLALKLKSGKVNFEADYKGPASKAEVNVYWVDSHFKGESKDALKELLVAMNDGNHDRSDSMTDYFDVGWYVDIELWNRGDYYEVTA